MATVYIGTDAFNLKIGDTERHHAQGFLSVSCTAEDDMPLLEVEMKVQEGADEVASCYVVGYEDIDALRRYCEMVLDLFDRGRLA